MSAIDKVTHVIFDLDGLLIDSETIYTRIFDTITAEYNKAYTWELKSAMMGKKEVEAAKVFIEALNLPMTVDQYLTKVNELVTRFMPGAPFMPGAEKLVQHLHKHKVPMAIATGSDQVGYKAKTLQQPEFFSLFSPVVLSSEDPDVVNGKPAPDCFLVAARRFPDKPDPSKCLVFEDAPNGASAGLAAGMRVVWVPDPRVHRGSLADKVSLLLTSLEDFKPEAFGLPPYDS